MFIEFMLVNIMKNQGTRKFPDKFDNPVPQHMATGLEEATSRSPLKRRA